MQSSSQKFLDAFDDRAAIRNDISNIAINWFVNRAPLITRSPRKPVGSVEYAINTDYELRTRHAQLTAPVAASYAATTLTVQSGFLYMAGDVLEILDTYAASAERVEVQAVTGPTTVVVRRGAEGTVPVANSLAGSVLNRGIRVIGNSRTGYEVSQDAINRIPDFAPQWCQTFQHPVQVGGSLQGSDAYVPSLDGATPLEQAKAKALQNLMDDMEVSSYYGIGEAPSAGGRPKQKGVRQQCTSNRVTIGALSQHQFSRLCLQPLFSEGGSPDTILVSPNWMTGLATWGYQVLRLDAGATEFGVSINEYSAPFIGDMKIIPCPLLKAGTAFICRREEIVWRSKRNEHWQDRGSRGDAWEGDFIAEGSIEVRNQIHHCWLEGVTRWIPS